MIETQFTYIQSPPVPQLGQVAVPLQYYDSTVVSELYATYAISNMAT